MTNAWIHRTLTFSFIAMAVSLAWFWKAQPYYLLLGICLLPLGIVALIEFIQFGLLITINKSDASPKASLGDFAKAYAGELASSMKVFIYWQPYQSRQIADNIKIDVKQRRGVVLVHGFFCNRGLWKPWLQQLNAEGRVFVAVDLEPVFGSIDNYWETIDTAVRMVWQATGKAPILVGHSMGGLAIRDWASRTESCNPKTKPYEKAHRIITLGTPHQGTWLGQFSHAVNGRQMMISSQWLLDLQLREDLQPRPPTTCFYSNCDNIVFPVSNATLQGAENRLVHGLGHVDMVLDTSVMKMCWKLLD